MNRGHTFMRRLKWRTTGTARGRDFDGLKRRVVAVLAGAILLVGASDLEAQGRVFHDGFEANNTNQWSYDNSKCTTATTAADGGKPQSGTYMAKCNWNGEVPWTNPSNRSTLSLTPPGWKYSREFLIRLWFRYDANMDHVRGAKLLRMSKYPTLSFYTGAQMETADKQMFIFFEGIDGLRGPLTYDGGVGGNNQWHKLEIYVKNNTPGNTDGTVRVWVDGVVRLEGVNLKSAHDGGFWEELTLMSNWDVEGHPDWAHDALNNVYWDDIEIYSDLGSGAKGSMANATISTASSIPSPAAPGQVRVIR